MEVLSIRFYMTAAITIGKTRRKQIPSEIMVTKKVHVNAYLSTQTNGKKFIVFHGAKCQSKSLDQKIKIKGAARSSLNSVMNEEIRPDWVKTVLGQFCFIEQLFWWDTFVCTWQKKFEVKNLFLKVSKSSWNINPGKCTNCIQAPELLRNKLFKALVSERYDEILATNLQECSEKGV